MERLNHQAELLLKKVTEEVDKHTVQDPLMELKLIWDSLDERIVSRQVKAKTCVQTLHTDTLRRQYKTTTKSEISSYYQ